MPGNRESVHVKHARARARLRRHARASRAARARGGKGSCHGRCCVLHASRGARARAPQQPGASAAVAQPRRASRLPLRRLPTRLSAVLPCGRQAMPGRHRAQPYGRKDAAAQRAAFHRAAAASGRRALHSAVRAVWRLWCSFPWRAMVPVSERTFLNSRGRRFVSMIPQVVWIGLKARKVSS